MRHSNDRGPAHQNVLNFKVNPNPTTKKTSTNGLWKELQKYRKQARMNFRPPSRTCNTFSLKDRIGAEPEYWASPRLVAGCSGSRTRRRCHLTEGLELHCQVEVVTNKAPANLQPCTIRRKPGKSAQPTCIIFQASSMICHTTGPPTRSSEGTGVSMTLEEQGNNPHTHTHIHTKKIEHTGVRPCNLTPKTLHGLNPKPYRANPKP